MSGPPQPPPYRPRPSQPHQHPSSSATSSATAAAAANAPPPYQPRPPQHQQQPPPPVHHQHQPYQHHQHPAPAQQPPPPQQAQAQQPPPPPPVPLPPQAQAPKVILLVNPARENHGLVKKMGEMADVTKLSQQLDPADAVFSYRSRSIGLLILSYPELRSHFPRVLAHVRAFHAKSSQHPIVVLISPRRDQTPQEWYALQEAAPLGRLSFLLACDLPDAAAGVGAVLGVVKDDGRRQRQSEWFLELARDASSSAAAEGVLRGLWGALGLDEKELWRLLGGAESIGRIASASEEQLLQDCPIDRRTARVLVDFLDGRRALGGGGGR